jgi:hypothetical protein
MHAPVSALPPNFPGADCHYYTGYYTVSPGADRCGLPGYYGCGDWCWYEGSVLHCPYNGLWTGSCGNGWRYYICWWNGYYQSCVMDIYWEASGNSCALDYDCDGLPDCADPDPVTPENRDKNDGNPNKCDAPDLSVGNPVNVANGNKYEEALDLSISTPGIPLEFKRAYNGHSSADGPLGYGWTHNFNLRVQVKAASPKRVIVWDSDGRALYFTEISQVNGVITFLGESGVKDRLQQVATGEYFLLRNGGKLTYQFASDSSNGRLLGISDLNGNTLALTYTGALLTQVSNNFGKADMIQYNGNNRISSVTDAKGQSITYGYTNGDLTSVIYPDTNSMSYTYSNHS